MKSVWKCLCNKATDFPVNIIPVVRSDTPIHNFQSVVVRYVSSGRVGNLVQDHVYVNDIDRTLLSLTSESVTKP